MPTSSRKPLLPASTLLRWLGDAGPDGPISIRSLLLGDTMASPKAPLAGPINSSMINVTALCRHAGMLFRAFLCLKLLLAARIAVLRRPARNTAQGIPTRPGFYLMVAIAWCTLDGSIGFAGMISGIWPLQILVGVTLIALHGPITARNYGAQRYAILLVSLIYLPLIAAAQLCGEPVLLIILLQIQLLFIGTHTILKRYRYLSISAPLAREESQRRALHDSLTGLLNRAGLAFSLSQYDANRQQFVIFHIDLNGFKLMNDTFGRWASDLIFVILTKALQSFSRKTGIVARIGGDQFVLVTPNMPPRKAVWVAERLIRSIADEPYVLEATGPVRTGASIGSPARLGTGPTRTNCCVGQTPHFPRQTCGQRRRPAFKRTGRYRIGPDP